MTAAEEPTEPDPVRAFVDALTPAARHHWYGRVNTFDAIPLIRAACERHTPKELARIASKGVQRRTPHNAHEVIMFRLRREAGQLDREGTP